MGKRGRVIGLVAAAVVAVFVGGLLVGRSAPPHLSGQPEREPELASAAQGAQKAPEAPKPAPQKVKQTSTPAPERKPQVIDWEAPAELTAEQRTELAKKIQTYKDEPDRLAKEYSKYHTRDRDFPISKEERKILRLESGDYDQLLDAQERILALIASPPADPKAREQVDQLQERFRIIVARHENTKVDRGLSVDQDYNTAPHGVVLASAQARLLAGTLRNWDVAQVDSSIAYVHRTREFLRAQKQDIHEFFRDLDVLGK